MKNQPRLPNPPGRTKFFQAIADRLQGRRWWKHLIAIEFAYGFAKSAHKGQLRDDGERYFNHVKSVAWIIHEELDLPNQQQFTICFIAALLHDLIEDTYAAMKKHLHFVFDQISPEITRIIWDVTKDDKKTGIQRIQKLLRSTRVNTRIVKGADRLHNTRTLLACKSVKIDKKLKETKEVILPWLKLGQNQDPNIAILVQLIEKQIVFIEEELVRKENNQETYPFHDYQSES